MKVEVVLAGDMASSGYGTEARSCIDGGDAPYTGEVEFRDRGVY